MSDYLDDWIRLDQWTIDDAIIIWCDGNPGLPYGGIHDVTRIEVARALFIQELKKGSSLKTVIERGRPRYWEHRYYEARQNQGYNEMVTPEELARFASNQGYEPKFIAKRKAWMKRVAVGADNAKRAPSDAEADALLGEYHAQHGRYPNAVEVDNVGKAAGFSKPRDAMRSALRRATLGRGPGRPT